MVSYKILQLKSNQSKHLYNLNYSSFGKTDLYFRAAKVTGQVRFV